VAFLRVQTGIFDPTSIGDKARWYSGALQSIQFFVFDSKLTPSLGNAYMIEPEIKDDTPSGNN
jgi:hypothetical protein